MPQRMSAGIGQRFVLQVLILVAGNRIDRQERAADRPGTLGYNLFDMRQVLTSRCRFVVEQRIGPERGLVSMPVAQQLQDGFKERPVLHAEGDLLQVQSVDVLSTEQS